MSDERKDDAQPSGEAKPKRRIGRVGAGVAMGIGSAAIVAALLYANRNRRSDREDKD